LITTPQDARSHPPAHHHYHTLLRSSPHHTTTHPSTTIAPTQWTAEGFDPDTFNPKTFFKLHDTNEDGFLDEKEVEAVVQRPAEKLHARGHGEAVDMAAIAEEAARMREHMFDLMDTDKVCLLASIHPHANPAVDVDNMPFTLLSQ
jgi:hypothetical protein